MSIDLLAYNLAGLPADFACMLVFETVAEIEDRRHFEMTVGLGFVIVRILRAIFGDGMGLIIAGIILLAILYYGTGSLGRRFLSYVIAFSFTNILQVPTTILWMSLYGEGPQAIQHETLQHPEYFLFQLLMTAILLASLQVPRVILRYMRAHNLNRADGLTLLLLAVQMLWVWPTYYLYPFLGKGISMVAVVGFCQIISLIAFLLLIDDVGAAIAARESEARTEVLEEAARGYERHYREVEQAIGRAATLRHELRNQLQVAEGLAARGDSERARELLDSLAGTRSSANLAAPDPPLAASTPAGGIMTPAIRRRAWDVAYLANGLLGAVMFVWLVRLEDVSARAVVAFVVVLAVWATLTPYLVRTIRKAQEAELAAVRVQAAQEMVDARVWYGARIAAELNQARELEEGLHARIGEAQKRLRAGEAPVGETSGADTAARAYEPWCQNRALDTLMELKAATCEGAGIRLTCSLDVPRELGLSDLELCTLFSNMLDNAITACAALPEEERWVDVAAAMRAGRLVAVVRNSCAEGTKTPAGGARGITDEHGWGLRILSELAKRHDGTMSAEAEEGVFTVRVVFDVC